MFSPRGRTPVLWGLITRRNWPSTGPSKAQLLPSPTLPPAPPLSADLRLGLWSPLSPQGWALPTLLCGADPLRTLFPTHFLLTCNLWGVCLVKGSVNCR